VTLDTRKVDVGAGAPHRGDCGGWSIWAIHGHWKEEELPRAAADVTCAGAFGMSRLHPNTSLASQNAATAASSKSPRSSRCRVNTATFTQHSRKIARLTAETHASRRGLYAWTGLYAFGEPSPAARPLRDQKQGNKDSRIKGRTCTSESQCNLRGFYPWRKAVRRPAH
jgi:hypothetical protein